MQKIIKKIIILKLAIFARLVLWRYKPFIIAVAGSVGKTSTKDAVYHVLNNAGLSVRKSQHSFNSEIGLPISILGVDNPWGSYAKLARVFFGALWLLIKRDTSYPKYLVLETGVGKPDDMKYLLSIIKPDISVLTNLPDTPVHVEYFASREDLWNEEAMLFLGTKAGGVCIANNADLNSKSVIAKQFETHINKKLLWFGASAESNNDATVYIDSYTFVQNTQGLPCVRAVYVVDKKQYEITHDTIVAPYALDAFLPALCIAKELLLNIEKTMQSLHAFVPPPGRMRVFHGMNGSILVDDTYNSSPVASKKALDVLHEISIQGKKIAVLADMLELGEYSPQAHLDIGEYAIQKADVVLAVGAQSKAIATGAQQYVEKQKLLNKVILYAPTYNDISEDFISGIQKGDCVLVKGSQGMRMERLSKKLLARASDLSFLCRQAPGWLKKIPK